MNLPTTGQDQWANLPAAYSKLGFPLRQALATKSQRLFNFGKSRKLVVTGQFMKSMGRINRHRCRRRNIDIIDVRLESDVLESKQNKPRHHGRISQNKTDGSEMLHKIRNCHRTENHPQTLQQNQHSRGINAIIIFNQVIDVGNRQRI